ncbi:uncharacterized protein LOC110425808 isoform X2 [Herrania umbratica]|uniref:Uncharacterized protein LOC110425808 isoform X2 n=1 Tax=Herrania umbratica TaxID=108875 RepID=A0A6J1BBM4_9ROSI|nr:uncharacterized protein LOC110425808 isoform X2 [Herrania umbratica]
MKIKTKEKLEFFQLQSSFQAFLWVVWFGEMMSESHKAINVFSTSTSSSRLSPLARPFTVNNPYNLHESFDPLLDSSSSSSSSSSSHDQPFPCLSLGNQGHRGYHAYHSDATSITAFPCVDDPDFQFDSRFAYYQLEEPPLHSYFTLSTHQSSQTNFIPSSSSFGNVGLKGGLQGTAVHQQGTEILRCNDQVASAGSLSCNNLLEQGTTLEESKLVSETSSVLHGKGSVVIGKDNQIRPEDKEKIHTESSIFPLANSTIFPYESCFPHLGSCHAETLVSHARECFSYSAQICRPSSAGPNPPIVNPVPLVNVATGGTDAVSSRDSYFGYVLPSMMDTSTVHNPVDKVACHDQVIIEKGEKGKIVEPFHDETKNPSIRAKSKLRIACPNVPQDLTLEQHGAKPSIPDDKSFTNHGDSDVDSPCWKGTQANKSPLRDSVPMNSEGSKGQSPSRVSVPLKSEHSKNEKVACNSLNPQVPLSIPGNSKQKVDHHQKEGHGDSSLSSQKSAALDVTSSSSEHRLTDSVKAVKFPSERIDDIGIQSSSDVHDSKKEYGIPYKSFISSAANSSCSFRPYLREEYVTSESQLVRGINVAGSMEGIAAATHNGLDSFEDIAHHGPNTSFSFLTTETALNSHSSGVGVFSDFTERLQEPSKSTPPKIDVKLMINTIQYLSELLLQNSSFDLGSLSEHEYNKLLNIMNNLYVLIRNKAGQMAVRPESIHPCTLYCRRQPADHHERIQVTKVKDKAVLHNQEMYKMSAPMLSSRMLYSFYQSNNEGFKKGSDICQVIEKDPKVVYSIEKEMPPEALLYRDLWLEAKAAGSLKKYPAHALQMQSEPDRYRSE